MRNEMLMLISITKNVQMKHTCFNVTPFFFHETSLLFLFVEISASNFFSFHPYNICFVLYFFFSFYLKQQSHICDSCCWCFYCCFPAPLCHFPPLLNSCSHTQRDTHISVCNILRQFCCCFSLCLITI